MNGEKHTSHAPRLTVDERKKVEQYNNGVKDWTYSSHHGFANNVPPRPFPDVPHKIDDQGNDTGELLIPAALVPIKFANATIDGATRLVIVVPDQE
jgi:hypothetical protein